MIDDGCLDLPQRKRGRPARKPQQWLPDVLSCYSPNPTIYTFCPLLDTIYDER